MKKLILPELVNPSYLEKLLGLVDTSMYKNWFLKKQAELNELVLINSRTYSAQHSGDMPAGLLYEGIPYYIAGNNNEAAIAQTDEIEEAVCKIITTHKKVLTERELVKGYINSAFQLAETDADMTALLDDKVIQHVFSSNFEKDSLLTLSEEEITHFKTKSAGYVVLLMNQLTRNLLLT